MRSSAKLYLILAIVAAVLFLGVIVGIAATIAGLASFPLLSGGKGLLVVAPLAPRREWATVREFAAALARVLATATPECYVERAAPDRFTVATLPRRLAALERDPWAGYFDLRQAITPAALAAVGLAAAKR